MTENTQPTGTIQENRGLSLDEANDLFSKFYGKTANEVKALDTEKPAGESKPVEEVKAAPTEPAKEPESKSTEGETKAAVEPAKTDPVEAVKQPESTNPYAWVDKLPDDVKSLVVKELQQRAQAEHQFRSENGRVQALAREMTKIKKELAEARQKPTEPQDNPAANASIPKSPKEWDDLIENDPTLAKAIEARLQSRLDEVEQRLTGKVKSLKESAIDPLNEALDERHFEYERQALIREVPNYVEVINGPMYQTWFNQVIPPTLKASIQGCSDHREAIYYLQMFARDAHQLGWVKNEQAAKAPETTKPATPPAATELADKIAKERQAKLEAPTPAGNSSATPVGTNNTTRNNYTVDDAQTLMEEYYKTIRSGGKVK